MSLDRAPEPDESRLAAARTIPTAMTTSAAPVPGCELLSRCHCDECGDRPLRRDDRCDDSDLADSDSRVHEQQSHTVADSGEEEPPAALPSTSGTPRISAHGSVSTSPMSMTQASTDVAPISLVARVAQIMVKAQANAAPSPPRTAIIDGQPNVALRRGAAPGRPSQQSGGRTCAASPQPRAG